MGMETGMKTYRSTFEENFRAVKEPCGSKKGFRMRYVYIGPWYVWNLPEAGVRTAKRLIGLACGFSAVLFFLGSLVDSFLNYSRYVELTGMLSIAALVFEGFGVVQFCAAKEKMTNVDFDDIRAKMLIAPLLHALLLFATVIAAVCQLAGRGFSAMDGAVPVCYFLSGLLSLLIFLYYRSLPYRKDRNENAKIGLDDSEEAGNDGIG